ncbi:MAG TPA: hypothetical protein VN841_21570 [Bryobacteraceae bacterium]|nr:hypothetical protein [Bryobacteraceae bacterium]
MKPFAFWTALIVTVCLACVAHAQSNPTNQDAAVRAVIKTFADARNARDGDAVAATYAEDGEYINLNGVRTRGAHRAVVLRIPGFRTGAANRSLGGVRNSERRRRPSNRGI